MMPPKATYKKFESEPGLEFEFYLADRLGMTVARLRAEMPHHELVAWHVYHGRKAQRRELAEKQAANRRRRR
ncbi:hypothetical protein FHU38_000971 [Saccharomonospora amisosensis]|uniref:Uncharacterized protein n=1 Tax=Saccharomonospora amisosensis TaxID=1128677 RepID=A0A7X5UMU5_9PSEU|nr:hypothetical protein [Saccharomonospora amisosensis]NIJ10627.1 hypothetical protein [Saccharomonospora amisosensis]